MFKSNILTRRSVDASKESNPKPKALAAEGKPSGVATRSRRPLGDITNATAAESAQASGPKRQAVNIVSELVEPVPAAEISVDKMEADVEDEDEEANIPLDERSYMNRDFDDIDSKDESNPLLVTEYVNEMYVNFKELEIAFMVNPNYMLNEQPYVNEKMRTILIDWLVK